MGFPVMSDTAENAPSPAPAGPIKRRGRPQAGPENHKQRVERLQAELREAQAALKLADEKRAVIVGHASLRHARHNIEFARQLAAALRAEVKAKADRAMIADLLGSEKTPPL
jgi:hypothetical protein